MITTSRVVVALAAAAVYTTGVAALSKITRNGRYLYDESGNRFYMKGIAYQPEGNVQSSTTNTYNEPTDFVDPLSNSTGCARDLPYLKQLGVNTIRVYSVNSSENHDDCMKALSDAGIYTLIDLSLPDTSITRESPAWSTNLLDTYLATIDTFSSYDNVLGYNVGNEVVNFANVTGAAAFLKAATRDVKAYLKAKSYNGLVGYSSIDGDANYRGPTAAYLACDPSNDNSDATAIDLYGLNNYEWCGNSTFEAAYEGTTADFANYNVVAYFSEFGNICGQTRTWTEVPALYSSQMTDVWSGGIAFSYFPRTSANSQFGMVTISSDGSSVASVSDDFNNLKSQYSQVSPPNSPSQSAAGSATYPSCPAQNATFLASTTLPPTPSDSACGCLQSSLSCYFQPQGTNQTAIAVTVGNLLNTACGLLGQAGSTCNDIAASGSAGTYGIVSQCAAQEKLSYVMSLYYELEKRDPNACSFGGSGVTRSTTTTASAVASSCLSSATGTSVPSSPATASGASTTRSANPTSSGSSGGGSSGAVALSVNSGAIGLAAMVLVSVVGGAMTLL